MNSLLAIVFGIIFTLTLCLAEFQVDENLVREFIENEVSNTYGECLQMLRIVRSIVQNNQRHVQVSMAETIPENNVNVSVCTAILNATYNDPPQLEIFHLVCGLENRAKVPDVGRNCSRHISYEKSLWNLGLSNPIDITNFQVDYNLVIKLRRFITSDGGRLLSFKYFKKLENTNNFGYMKDCHVILYEKDKSDPIIEDNYCKLTRDPNLRQEDKIIL